MTSMKVHVATVHLKQEGNLPRNVKEGHQGERERRNSYDYDSYDEGRGRKRGGGSRGDTERQEGARTARVFVALATGSREEDRDPYDG